MKSFCSFVRLLCLSLALPAACELPPAYQAPPAVTAKMTTGHNGKHLDQPTLERGRKLFASRCIDCHTLPPISHYTAKEWWHLVDEMGDRSNLNREQRDAIVAYILAARGQL